MRHFAPQYYSIIRVLWFFDSEKLYLEESNERSFYDGEMSYLIFNKYDILHKLKAKIAVNNLVFEDNIPQSK